MALKAFQQYLQNTDLSEDVKPIAQAVQQLIIEILDSGFSDLSISNYFQYLMLTPQIDKKTYSAIDSILVAKIQEMADSKVIDTDTYLRLFSLMEFVKTNSTQFSEITVEMFKHYLWDLEHIVLLNPNMPIEGLDLEDSIANFKEDYNLKTVQDLIDFLRRVKSNKFKFLYGKYTFDFQTSITRLYSLNFIDRIEAGLLMRLIIIEGDANVDELLGVNTSEAFPDLPFENLNIPTRFHNILKRYGYRTIGDIKYELLNGTGDFPGRSAGDKAVVGMVTALVQSDYLTDTQKVQIYQRFGINIQEEG